MITIDARKLQPPEPFERVVDALQALRPGDEILLLLEREPQPLFRFLSKNNYQYRSVMNKDGEFEIRIWEP